MTIDKNSDRKAVLEAVKEDSGDLELASDDHKADREIVLAERKVQLDVYSKKIEEVLNELIDIEINEFKKNETYKVRPIFSTDKFYLTRVEGSYESSLYSLIHQIMWHHGVYNDFLPENEYKLCKEVIENEPACIYRPSQEDELLQEGLDIIYDSAIRSVWNRLTKESCKNLGELADYVEECLEVEKILKN